VAHQSFSLLYQPQITEDDDDDDEYECAASSDPSSG
jgi:hypothetical protein